MRIFINGKAGFNPNQRRDRRGRWTSGPSMSEFEDEIRGQEYETMGAFDENGKLVHRKDGDENKVSFSDEDIEKMRGMDITHNHPYPGSGSLSIQDFASGMHMRVKSIKSVTWSGEWTKCEFDYDYIDAIKAEIAAEAGVAAEMVDIESMLHRVADTHLNMFQNRNPVRMMIAQGNEDLLYELTKDYGFQLMDDFSEGLKEHEENWAPVEIDKLWKITSGID